MKECSKSIIRRRADPNFLTRYFVGEGIDIGGAPDPLSVYRSLFPAMGDVRVWDLGDGDAQDMAGVADESYDFVHSSHCLEHLHDPAAGLGNWFRIVKPGGHLVVLIPDEDLYEQGVFPSTFNDDHKWTFTVFKRESWSAQSRNVLDLIAGLGPAADVQKIELLNSTFRDDLPRFDQTLTPIGECGIEFVIRKRPREDVLFGGRRPAIGNLTREQFTLLTGIRLRPQGDGGGDDRQALDAAIAAHRAGDLDTAAAAYARILETAPGNADALHLAGLIRLQRQDYEEAHDLIAKAVGQQPNTATYYISLGQVLEALGKRDDACRAFARAIHLAPDSMEAHTNLGAALADRKKFAEAEIVLRKALEDKPDDADARTALARVELLQGKTEAAVDGFRDVLKDHPDHANASNNLGVALALLGDCDGARGAFEAALSNDPDHVDAHFNYAHHLLADGDFAEGWAHHDWRLRRPDLHRRYAPPLWDGAPLDGRRILLWSEQGMGDAIQFVRYAPLVAERGGEVVVACKPALRRLFAGVQGVCDVVDAGDIGDASDFAAHAPLLSLPRIFGTDRATIPAKVPYFPVPAPLPVDAAGARLKVGLVWAGNPEHARDNERSRPLPEFEPLARARGDVAFFGLQFGDAAAQTPPAGMSLVNLVASDFDFQATASAMAALDLIVSVDTSVAHLAGALGLPVWVLVDAVPDWRWLRDGDDTPWYPTMRLFRRRHGEAWAAVFQRVADAIKQA
jgi:tetratricopeptide (TPR) repeat protein